MGRYAEARRAEKGRILTEFAEMTGYLRKHAARLLRGGNKAARSRPRPERRLYDEAVREALIVLWETSGRVCGKRLKPLIPMLIAAMERHGHLALDAEVRGRLETVSAATIDRILGPVRGMPPQNRPAALKLGIFQTALGARPWGRTPTSGEITLGTHRPSPTPSKKALRERLSSGSTSATDRRRSWISDV